MLSFLAGDGEQARRIRERDWTGTPLGPPERWPAALKALVGVMLGANQPMFVVWGPERLLLYNDRYAEILGDKHPAALGRPFLEVWAEIADDLRPVVDKAYAGVATHMDDIALIVDRRGHPEEAHFAFSYTPVRHEGGGVDGFFCPCSEITQAVMAERSVRESDVRNRQVLDSAIDYAIIATDLDGRVTRWNEGARRVLGWNEAEMLGETVERIFTPEDLAEGRPAVEMRCALEEGRGNDERWHRRKGGDRFWAAGELTPLRDADGGVAGFVKVLRDRTEQRLGEEALATSRGELHEALTELRRLNERLEAKVAERTAERDRVWRNSRDLLGVADDRGRWISVNPAWTRVLGWTEAELLGRTSEWLEHPDDQEATRAEVARLAAGAVTLAFENRFRTRDGRHVPLSWTATPEGGLLYCSARDVTADKERQAELEQAQEQLRQAQKMEAVGQLTGGIAHDFNNLLTGVIGSLDMMRRRLARGETDKVERYAEAAAASANRAAALTHRLLAFSRRQPLDPKPVDANRLVTGMEELLRRTIGEAIRLDIVTAGALWPTLCDPNQLESAVLNLAINARDAMPEGGRLTIETCNAHLDDAYAARVRDVKPGRYVCVCVSDTGAGMSADVMAKAFDPFFTTKPIGQGTGLGLSMIYGFARQSEGFAKIYSEEGRGTTVKLYLPRFAGEPEAEEEAGEPGHARRAEPGEVVLVVEDERAVRDIVVDVLEELGYRAVEAADGPSGLKLLQSGMRVDLLITDVGLPGLNGRQLADLARERRPGLPVLFMTGYAENAAIAHGFLEPGMRMITKPFAVDALAARIREIVEGSPAA